MQVSGPITNFLSWEFQQNFLMAPQQRSTKFAQFCAAASFSGVQNFQNIWEQNDGLTYHPEDQNAIYAQTPMLEKATHRVGYRKKGYLNSYAMATEQFHLLTADFRAQLAGDFARAWARFRDKVLLHEADGVRYVANTNNSNAVTAEKFPEENRVIAFDNPSGSTFNITNLNLKLLDYANTFFKNQEIEEGMMPVAVGSPIQIQGLLSNTEVTSADFNTVRTLSRGEVDTFYGFKFIQSKAAGVTEDDENATNFNNDNITGTAENFSDIYYKNTNTGKNAGAESDIKLAATSGYTKLAEGAEKMVFCHPSRFLQCGPIPRAGWMNVWQNPNRMGVLEFFQKDSIGYRRAQNEYGLVAYVKNGLNQGRAISQQPIEHRDYKANSFGSTYSWDFNTTQS